MENIQNIFFGKENIKKLNDNIIQNLNLQNLSNDQKRYVVELLINNMKLLWQKIDISKINNSNISTILTQFNTYAFNNTIKELKQKMNIQDKPSMSTSDLKFERDFKSNPQGPVYVPERAKSSNNPHGPNSYYMEESKKTHQLASQFDPEMDSLFRPIVPHVPDEPQFNNYSFGKGSNDTKQKLDDVRKLRDNELDFPRKPKQNELPDFLKPKATSVRSSEDYDDKPKRDFNINSVNTRNPKNTRNNNINNNKYKDNYDDEETDDTFLHSLNEDPNDLMSLNNFDLGVTDDSNYIEDKSSFAERLNKLKNERDNGITIPKNKNKVTFDDEIMDNIQPTSIKDLRKKRKDDSDDDNELSEEQKDFIKEKERKIILKKMEQENINYQKMKQLKMNQEYELRQLEEINRQKQERKEELNQLKEELKKEMGLTNNHVKKITSSEKKEFLKIFDELKTMNGKLIEEINTLREQLKNKKDETEFIEIKKEISDEFDKLTKLKKEHEEQLIEYNKVLEEYNKVTKIKKYLLDVSSENSLTYYTYNFNTINNIIGIQLEKFSIPEIEYNIEEDINNIFELEIDNENKQIILGDGKYDINSLIETLNTNDLQLEFGLDEVSQKITVKSNRNFIILPSTLSFNILGFVGSYNNNNEYKADKCFDLRRDNKVYLYLNNIDNTNPLAILYPNQTPNAEIKFENPISLDKLDIVFKNSKGHLCNFHNLEHSLTFNIEIT
jgi:hypothetical protein